MKKWLGPVISLITILICIPIVEVLLNLIAPVPDPYRVYKQVNQYIKSEFPPHYRLRTKVEEDLPGVRGQNAFTINNMGFRGDPLQTPKPEGEYRIFILGGSSAECYYLDDAESFGHILQEELNKRISGTAPVKVYNAGKSGDASDDHISMLVHRITHLEPDMVIVFSGVNDLTRSIYGYDYCHYQSEDSKSRYSSLGFLLTEFQIGRRLYYLLKHISPTERQVLEDITATSNYGEKIALRESVPISDEKPNVEVAAYQNNLRTIVGVAQAYGVELILITQQSTWNSTVDPEIHNRHWMLYRDGRTYRQDYMDAALESLNDAMRRTAAEYDVPLFDLAGRMPKSSEYFYDDVHFNVKGARTAAEELASFIVEHRLLPEQIPVNRL